MPPPYSSAPSPPPVVVPLPRPGDIGEDGAYGVASYGYAGDRRTGVVRANRSWHQVRYELELAAGFYGDRPMRKRAGSGNGVQRKRVRDASRLRASRNAESAPLRVGDVVHDGDRLTLYRVPMTLDDVYRGLTPYDVGVAYVNSGVCLAPMRVDFTGGADDEQRLSAWCQQNDEYLKRSTAPLLREQMAHIIALCAYDARTEGAAAAPTTEDDDDDAALLGEARSAVRRQLATADDADDAHRFVRRAGAAPARPPPANYVCYRCRRRAAHFFDDCPTHADAAWRPKRAPTGIPRSQLRVATTPAERAAAPYFDAKRDDVYLVPRA